MHFVTPWDPFYKFRKINFKCMEFYAHSAAGANLVGNLVKIGGNLMKERVRHKRSHCETLSEFSYGSEYHFLWVGLPFPAAGDRQISKIKWEIWEIQEKY